MKLVDVPERFPIPFGNDAGPTFIRGIPTAHQTPSGSDAPASLFDGFAGENFQPLDSGGFAPDGRDFNGILYRTTAGVQWDQAGGPNVYDSTFSTAIGGYPQLAILQSTTPGIQWQSTADDNTTDPDGGSPANWIQLTVPPNVTSGSVDLPGGIRIQWGYTAQFSAVEPAVPTVFAQPFANGSYGISVSPAINAPSGTMDTWIQVINSTKTATGFSAQYQRGAGGTQPGLDGYYYLAIGLIP